MLMIQGEEFHAQLLPTFIETSLQILRQASMISSHDIPEIVLGQNTIMQSITMNKQKIEPKYLLYPGKVVAYTMRLRKKKNNTIENENINYRRNDKILVAIADSGHHRIIICTLQGRVKVIHFFKYFQFNIGIFGFM